MLFNLIESNDGEMFADILKREGIPCAAVPCGSGVWTAFGLKLENLGIYVPFEFFEKASNILKDFSEDSHQRLRKDLSDNLDKLNANPRLEKKMRKKLKLSEEVNFFDYCREKILQADKIVDEGQIGGYSQSHYLFVYTDSEIIVIDSQTYEVLSAKPK